MQSGIKSYLHLVFLSVLAFVDKRVNQFVTMFYEHCMKSVVIRSFSCPYFLAFKLNTCSVQMLKNTDQKNSKYRHFLRSIGFIAEKKKKALEAFENLNIVKWHKNVVDWNYVFFILIPGIKKFFASIFTFLSSLGLLGRL